MHLSGGQKGRSVSLTAHPHPAPRLGTDKVHLYFSLCAFAGMSQGDIHHYITLHYTQQHYVLRRPFLLCDLVSEAKSRASFS